MNRHRLVIGLAALFVASVEGGGETTAPRQRRFELTYLAEIPVPEGTGKLDVWLPYPRTDEHQTITPLGVSAPHPAQIHQESEFGNSILYLSAQTPKEKLIRIEMRFRVTRREYVRRDFASSHRRTESEGNDEIEKWLEPDRLVPIDGFVKELAEEVTRGKATALEKAQAIYDYTVDTLTYDKSGTGWGRGDIYYACDAKRGNCTDFHAVFIGLARAVGIPAKFAIGLPLPPDRSRGEIEGYHCWAEFHLPGYGWVPVDTSEANKHPEKRHYFFGAHDENRVEFTVGRDIELSPRQSDKPMNFFIYPHAEADGEPIRDIRKRFFFKAVDADTPP